MEPDLTSAFDHVLEGERAGAGDGAERALAGGAKAEQVLNKALIGAMIEVGRRFESGEL
jgi:methanogenic corrinoid protein MtbC1